LLFLFSETPVRNDRKRRWSPPSLSRKWNPKFPVRQPASFAVRLVAPDPPSPASTLQYDPPSPASTLKYESDDQRSFTVTPSRAPTLRYDETHERPFVGFPTFGWDARSTVLLTNRVPVGYTLMAVPSLPKFGSTRITLDGASEPRGAESRGEEYHPKGDDVLFYLLPTFP
jgi:hypothetical protein